MNSLAPDVQNYYRAREIARALTTEARVVHKKQITRLAEREHWPSRREGNRLLFCPPPEIASIILTAPESDSQGPAPEVKFADLAHSDVQRDKVLLRERAVTLLQSNLVLGKEVALQLVCEHFAKEHPLFGCSVSSLRRWATAYAANGLDGLVEQKRGRSGSKPFARDLDEETILRYRAASVEHGAGGRLNIARGYRNLVADPTVNGAARKWLHGANASKSYVPPSVRDALRVSELGTKLIQIGPKAMKLDGPYTACTYENVPAGHSFTADDMTANAYVWVEWPNEAGFLLIRPQILAAMDIGTMRWLNVRAIIRPKGQYNKDDVWGLLGDVMDHYGVFKQAVLEGGTWQSNVVIGTKTGLDDNARFGGLRALGTKVIHTRTPRGKIIETAFNQLQYAADTCRGFCGRNEREDCPETVKHQLYQVTAGHAHPREFFLNLKEYTDHLTKVMDNLNHERNDGKILRGRCPNDKWAEDAPQLQAIPDKAKWMYRASYRVLAVTQNGVRVTVGSGKYQTHYTYSNPALEIQRGRRVVVFWNDYDPDTDAVIYTIKDGRQYKLICVASRVRELPKFGATEAQTAADATRKKLQAQVARTEARSLAPFLQRTAPLAPEAAPATEAVGEQIAAARAASEAKTATRQRVQRDVNAAARDITPEDTAAALEAPAPRTEEFSADEISQLFGDSNS